MKYISRSIPDLLKVSKRMLILRGIVLLLLGVSMFYKPLFTLWYLTVAIGILVIIDGIAALAATLRGKNQLRSIMIIDAIFLIMLGFFAVISPLMMDVIWIMLIGIWEILSGLQSIFLREESNAPRLTLTSGIISIIIGIFFLAAPSAGVMGITWLIALFLLAAAAVCFFTAWKISRVTVDLSVLEDM